jgi:hypothetical protein
MHPICQSISGTHPEILKLQNFGVRPEMRLAAD